MSGGVDSDFVIIGGGIAGIGCAAGLPDDARIVVLEAEASVGYHASARSAAIFIPAYGGDEIRRLSALAEPYFESPPDALDTPGLLSPRGELLIAVEGEEEDMSAVLAAAPGIEELTVDEAVAQVPILRREVIRRVCIEPRARDIDADRLLHAWLRLARRRGTTVHTAAPATGLAREDGRWRVDTPRGVFRAPVVVNAAGAWCDAVAGLAGLAPLGLVPHRRSAAVLPPPGDLDVNAWPLFGSVNETWYAKPLAGKLMVSPADEDPVPPHDAFTDDMVLAEGLYRYEQAVTEPVTRVEHQWAGLRTFAPDRVPVVGFDPRVEGLFWLAGQGGYGIQTAPAMSRLAAARLVGEDLDEAWAALAGRLDPARLVNAGSIAGGTESR